MNHKSTDFPQYRMLSNGKSFYKIVSDRAFEEIQLIGTRLIRHSVVAEQYPEILKIQDLLDGQDGIYLPVEEHKWRELNRGSGE